MGLAQRRVRRLLLERQADAGPSRCLQQISPTGLYLIHEVESEGLDLEAGNRIMKKSIQLHRIRALHGADATPLLTLRLSHRTREISIQEHLIQGWKTFIVLSREQMDCAVSWFYFQIVDHVQQHYVDGFDMTIRPISDPESIQPDTRSSARWDYSLVFGQIRAT